MFGIYESGIMIAKFAAPLTLSSNVPTTASDTQSLKRTFYKSQAQRWELTAEIMPLTSGAEDLFVSLVTRGSTETFTISVPQNYGVIKKMTSGSFSPTASGSALSDTLTIANNTGNFIPKGSMIKIGTTSKIYMTTSERSGNGTITVFPRLLSNVSGTLYHRADVMMPAYVDTDTVKGMVYSDGIMMAPGQLKFMEALI